MQVQQRQCLHLIHGRGLIPQTHQIIHTLLCHIACRHGEVLCGEQSFHGIYRENPGHVCLGVGFCLCLSNLFLAFLQLRKILLQLLFCCFQLFQTCLQLRILRHSGGHLAQIILKLLLILSKLCQSAFQLFFPIKNGLFRFLKAFIDKRIDLCINLLDLFPADNDIDALLQQTGGTDTCYAFNTLQFRHNGIFRKFTDLCIIHSLSAHCRDHDGHHIRIQLHDNGISHGIIPKRLNLIQILPNLQGYRIHIRCLGEFQHNHGIILVGNRHNVLNVADSSHSRFRRLRHHCLHSLRAGAGICSHNNYVGQIDVGQQISRHPGEGYHAENDGKYYANQYCIGFFDTEL